MSKIDPCEYCIFEPHDCLRRTCEIRRKFDNDPEYRERYCEYIKEKQDYENN